MKAGKKKRLLSHVKSVEHYDTIWLHLCDDETSGQQRSPRGDREVVAEAPWFFTTSRNQSRKRLGVSLDGLWNHPTSDDFGEVGNVTVKVVPLP